MNKRNLTFIITLFSCILAIGQKPRFKEKKVAVAVEKHINYLASDDLGGRLTATQGGKMSAEYIAKEFASIGLEAKGEDGYFQYLETIDIRMAQSDCHFQIGKSTLSLYKEYFPISISSNQAYQGGDVINVGYGIHDGGLNQLDYKDKIVKNKAVFINVDIPRGKSPDSKFISWFELEMRAKYAKSRGAKAVFFYSDNKDIYPSGSLAKSFKNIGIPVLFIKKNLDEMVKSNYQLRLNILVASSKARNVIGYIDNCSKNTVVIGAHHDHLGRGQKGGSLSEKIGDIHNGADDNASGVAGLIELAKMVKNKPKKFSKNNYLFVAFTGEEQGLLGSKHFLKNSRYEPEFINYMINMDMIGHLDSTAKTLIINGVGTSPAWNTTIKKTRHSKRKIAKIKTTESGIGDSDHTSFYLQGIPAIHFFTGQHQHYHKPTDDVEIVNFGGEAFVLCYMYKFMVNMDKMGKLAFSKTKDESTSQMNFAVTLGIMPDYIYSGEGMRVDGVKEGKPGSKAGMKKGDVIIAMSGKPVANIQDYMKILTSMKKDSQTTVTVRRGDITKKISVQF